MHFFICCSVSLVLSSFTHLACRCGVSQIVNAELRSTQEQLLEEQSQVREFVRGSEAKLKTEEDQGKEWQRKCTDLEQQLQVRVLPSSVGTL